MSKIDYRKLYLIQNKFLDFWKTLNLPFYLTGGTALGRFYLNHRYSEDLDFFVNQDNNFNEYINFFSNKLEDKFINEIDIDERINSFPISLLEKVDWFLKKPDFIILSKYIKRICMKTQILFYINKLHVIDNIVHF